jgi:hypothetical protein
VRWRGLASVDRWGPATVAVLAVLIAIGVGWHQAAQDGKLYGNQQGQQLAIDGLQRQLGDVAVREAALRGEIATWQAYVVVLSKRMTEHGIAVPDPPRPLPPPAAESKETTRTRR